MLVPFGDQQSWVALETFGDFETVCIKAVVSTTEREIEGDATRKKISERGHLKHRAENQEGRHHASGQLLLSAASTEKRSNAVFSFY